MQNIIDAFYEHEIKSNERDLMRRLISERTDWIKNQKNISTFLLILFLIIIFFSILATTIYYEDNKNVNFLFYFVMECMGIVIGFYPRILVWRMRIYSGNPKRFILESLQLKENGSIDSPYFTTTSLVVVFYGVLISEIAIIMYMIPFILVIAIISFTLLFFYIIYRAFFKPRITIHLDYFMKKNNINGKGKKYRWSDISSVQIRIGEFTIHSFDTIESDWMQYLDIMIRDTDSQFVNELKNVNMFRKVIIPLGKNRDDEILEIIEKFFKYMSELN